MIPENIAWRKPSACGDAGSCVEVAQVDDKFALGRNGSARAFYDAAEFVAFYEAMRQGEYADLYAEAKALLVPGGAK